MHKKMGRPIEENPKNKLIKVYVTNDEYTNIISYCEKHNKISKSEAGRCGYMLLIATDKIGKKDGK